MISQFLHSSISNIGPLLQQMPIPRDLPLPLPLWDIWLKIFLIGLFLLHILFVNLMVGGTLFVVIFEFFSLKWPKYEKMARSIANTITVNKSLAVVLGVGPLLCINLLYTHQFYAANALTGHAWWALIPLVTSAFLLTYLHKYTWDKWRGEKKARHVAVGVIAMMHFLFIPLIFLSNINLMLFPDKWYEVQGFFSSLQIGNVFPRYFHFMAACNAITGLFLVGYFGRKGFDVETAMPEFTKPQLKRIFYHVAFWVSLAQFVFGPFLLFTLPRVGLHWTMVWVILSGATIAGVAMSLMWKEIKSSDDQIGKRYPIILFLFAITVTCMGTGRQLYREASLTTHKLLMKRATQEFNAIEYATQLRLKAGLGAGDALNAGPTPKSVFMETCAACHAYDKVLAAPPLTEVYELHKDHPEDIVTWAKAPGKKRPEFAQMQSFAHLGEEKLMLAAKYMLAVGSGEVKLGDPIEKKSEEITNDVENAPTTETPAAQ